MKEIDGEQPWLRTQPDPSDPKDLAFYEGVGRKLDATLMSKKKKVALDKLSESLGQIRDNLVVNLLKEGKHLYLLMHFQQDFLPYADVFNDVAPFEVEMPQGANAIVVKDSCAYVARQSVSRMEMGDHVMVPGIEATSDVTGVAGGRSGPARWHHVVTPVTPKASRLAKAQLRLQDVNGVPTAPGV